MNIEIKEKFPSWCKENTFHDNMLGDDLDSLLCSEFNEEFNWYATRWFYDFNNLYIKKDYEPERTIVGNDLDLIQGKCWGNHCSILSPSDKFNEKSANLNVVSKITRNNYTRKYAGSTIATILSYYDRDLSQLSDKAKMLIMCVDSHFMGFYSNFHDTQKYWLVDVLDYPELYEMTKKYKYQDFVDLQNKYNLKGKIYINNDGYLETDIDLAGVNEILGECYLFGKEISLPQWQFENYGLKLKQQYANTGYKQTKSDIINKKIFSYSQTYKNSCSFTYVV